MTAWTIDRLARRVAEAALSEHLRGYEPWPPYELAELVGKHADEVGRKDLVCHADSPEVDAAQVALTTLVSELASYCEFGPNPSPEAYLKACVALEKWRERAEVAEAELAQLRAAPQ